MLGLFAICTLNKAVPAQAEEREFLCQGKKHNLELFSGKNRYRMRFYERNSVANTLVELTNPKLIEHNTSSGSTHGITYIFRKGNVVYEIYYHMHGSQSGSVLLTVYRSGVVSFKEEICHVDPDYGDD